MGYVLTKLTWPVARSLDRDRMCREEIMWGGEKIWGSERWESLCIRIRRWWKMLWERGKEWRWWELYRSNRQSLWWREGARFRGQGGSTHSLAHIYIYIYIDK